MVDGALVITRRNGAQATLLDPSQFAGYQGAASAPGVVLLRHNNLHIEIHVDHAHPIGTTVQPASLEIELPAGATLFVDGRMVPGTGSVRTFSTPELPAGKTYYYDMKAEVTVDGKVVHEEHRVVVRGGESLKQSFGELIARAKSATPSDLAKK